MIPRLVWRTASCSTFQGQERDTPYIEIHPAPTAYHMQTLC